MTMNAYVRMGTYHKKSHANLVVSPANNAHNREQTARTIEHHFML